MRPVGPNTCSHSEVLDSKMSFWFDILSYNYYLSRAIPSYELSWCDIFLFTEISKTVKKKTQEYTLYMLTQHKIILGVQKTDNGTRKPHESSRHTFYMAVPQHVPRTQSGPGGDTGVPLVQNCLDKIYCCERRIPRDAVHHLDSPSTVNFTIVAGVKRHRIIPHRLQAASTLR